MIDACAKQGEAAKAEGWLSRMQGAGLQPDVISYNAVINACARSRPPARESAERIFLWMVGASVPPNAITLRTLARAIGQDFA